MTSDLKICFIGMSHLGLVSSVVAASKGIKVVCYDENTKLIKDLENGLFTVKEPKLKDLFLKNRNNIRFSSDLSFLDKMEIIFISKDIETNNQNKSNLEGIKNLLSKIKNYYNPSSIVVINSQIPPGFCQTIKEDFSEFYYQVETLVFGEAIDRAMYPERIIVGYENKIKEIYLNYLKMYNCKIYTMSFESAELTKLAINLYLISSVTFANVMHKVSNEIGANWPEIIPALKEDKRIGHYSYINPGLGLSGGNLERDLNNILLSVKTNSLQESYFKLIQQINKNKKKMPALKFSFYKEKFGKPKKIAILGFAYKQGTNSFKNSPTLDLLESFDSDDEFLIFDPIIKKYKNLSEKHFSTDLKIVLSSSSVIFIMTNLSVFKHLDRDYLKYLKDAKMIVDPFNIICSPVIKSKNLYFST